MTTRQRAIVIAVLAYVHGWLCAWFSERGESGYAFFAGFACAQLLAACVVLCIRADLET